MHGRIKVKTTAQQEEEKRKKQAEKVTKLKWASGRIFDKVERGIYDEEGMKMTGSILSVNADFYSLWNYRRNFFIRLIEDKVVDDDAKDRELEQELEFAQARLKESPKSYSCWHHRCWITTRISKCDWSNELSLCNLFLQFDERNFHCWDYRRFVIDHCGDRVTTSDELAVTQDLISRNFSNYSSWHYRSKLLTKESKHLDDDVLKDELSLVQKAYFTDPNDQSAWFYHRWLIGRQPRPLQLLTLRVESSQVECVVSQTLPDPQDLKILVDGSPVESEWTVESSEVNKNANFYRCQIPLDGASEVEASLNGNLLQIRLEGDSTKAVVVSDYQQMLYDGVDDKMAEVLEKEIECLRELDEFEPDNKWVLLTMARLMLKVDARRHSDDVITLLERLSKVDVKRVNYYRDMASRHRVETHLCQQQPHCELSMVDMKLTRISSMEFLTSCTHIDLSNNLLTTIDQNFSIFRHLVNFKANNNRISTFRGLLNCPKLQQVELEGNSISSLDDVIKMLQKCDVIELVSLKGNPLIKDVTPPSCNRFNQIVVYDSH